MLFPEDNPELEKQLDEASAALLLLLFNGRRNVRSDRQVEFLPRRGVFRVDGKVVSVSTIRILLIQLEGIGRTRLQKHLDDLVAQRITVDEWYKRTASSLRVGHYLATALAVGSLDKANQNAEADKRVQAELAFLLGFASDLKAKKVSEAKMRSRANQYLLAIPITYWFIDQAEKIRLKDVRRVRNISAGIPLTDEEIFDVYTEAKRYRRARESCSACVEYSGRWIPIKQMPPIGSLDCGGRCRCFIVYR